MTGATGTRPPPEVLVRIYLADSAHTRGSEDRATRDPRPSSPTTEAAGVTRHGSQSGPPSGADRGNSWPFKMEKGEDFARKKYGILCCATTPGRVSRPQPAQRTTSAVHEPSNDPHNARSLTHRSHGSPSLSGLRSDHNILSHSQPRAAEGIAPRCPARI